MIIVSHRRSGAAQLASYLLRQGSNEEVIVRAVDNYPTGHRDDLNLRHALKLMELQAKTQGKRSSLYHVIIALQKSELFDRSRLEYAVDAIASALYMAGHQRVIVEHRKHGRQHFHVVINMINPETRRISVPFKSDYKLRRLGADLRAHFGLKPVPLKNIYLRFWEIKRGKASGIDPLMVRKAVTEIFRISKNGKEFIENLEKAGYRLSAGRKNCFVIVDHAGDAHVLLRRIEGIRLKDLHQKFPDLSTDTLPSAEDVSKQIKRERPASDPRQQRYGTKSSPLAPAGKTSIPQVREVRATKSLPAPMPVRPLLPTNGEFSKLLAQMARPPYALTTGSGPAGPFLPPRRARKNDENLPDSEKGAFRRPDMDADELLAWAFENGKHDVLALFGIHLKPDAFEP